MDDRELSSRRENLQDELRRVQDTVATLDAHIEALKEDLGLNLPQTLNHDTHIQLWRNLTNRGPIADACRELHALRSKGRKNRGGRLKGRPNQTPLLVNMVSNTKRPRGMTKKEKRLETIWNTCVSILSSLKKHRFAWPFLQPVDAEALNIPDYYEVITHPMDLSTITSRLEHDPRHGRYRHYASPIEFRDDMRLVWRNCRTYNRPGQDVRMMGDTLSELWEKKWCQAEIESKWENEMERDEDEESVGIENVGLCENAFQEDPNGVNPRKKNRVMPFGEKRKLAQQIGLLSSDQLEKISEFLEKLGVKEEDGEMVVDFEKMDSQKLWSIKHEVDAITSKIKRTPIQP